MWSLILCFSAQIWHVVAFIHFWCVCLNPWYLRHWLCDLLSVYFTACTVVSAITIWVLRAFCTSSWVASEIIAEKCILFYLFFSVDSQTDSVISFIPLLNSSTSSFSIFCPCAVLNTAVESLCSTILCHLLFFLTWVRFKFSCDSHTALCLVALQQYFLLLLLLLCLHQFWRLQLLTLAHFLLLLFLEHC